jgi:hypothetical protein
MPKIPDIPIDLPTEQEMKSSIAPLAGVTLGVGTVGFGLDQLLNWQNGFPDGWREAAKVITLLTSGAISGAAFATSMDKRDDLGKVGNGFAGGMLAITVLQAAKEIVKAAPPMPFSMPNFPFSLGSGNVRVVDRRTGGSGCAAVSQSPPKGYRTDAPPSGYRTDAAPPQGYRTDGPQGGYRG